MVLLCLIFFILAPLIPKCPYPLIHWQLPDGYILILSFVVHQLEYSYSEKLPVVYCLVTQRYNLYNKCGITACFPLTTSFEDIKLTPFSFLKVIIQVFFFFNHWASQITCGFKQVVVFQYTAIIILIDAQIVPFLASVVLFRLAPESSELCTCIGRQLSGGTGKRGRDFIKNKIAMSSY